MESALPPAPADGPARPAAPEGMEWVWVGETPPGEAPEGMEWVPLDELPEHLPVVAGVVAEADHSLATPAQHQPEAPPLAASFADKPTRSRWVGLLGTVAIDIVVLLVILSIANLF